MMFIVILVSVFMGVLFLIGGGIEVVMNGYGVNGYVFYLLWLWDVGLFGVFVVYFMFVLFFFVLGFIGVMIYKSWGQLVFLIVSIGFFFVFIGLLFVVVWMDLWNEIGVVIMDFGVVGFVFWGFLFMVVFIGVLFFVFCWIIF